MPHYCCDQGRLDDVIRQLSSGTEREEVSRGIIEEQRRLITKLEEDLCTLNEVPSQQTAADGSVGLSSLLFFSLNRRLINKPTHIVCRITNERRFPHSHFNKPKGSLQEKEQGAGGGENKAQAHPTQSGVSFLIILFLPFCSKCSSFNSSCKNSGNVLKQLPLTM